MDSTENQFDAEIQGIADRIKSAIGDESVNAFAGRCGISESAIRSYISHGRFPSIEKAYAIAKTSGVSLEWLATGKAPGPHKKYLTEMPKDIHHVSDAPPVAYESSEYVAIPFFTEVNAAAGHGALNGSTNAPESLMFKEAWLRIELRTKPQDLVLIRAIGDSMEPTLRSGDVILIDTSAKQPDREGVYIIRMGDMLMVKRLQRLPGKKLNIISDNPQFKTFEVKLDDPETAEMEILGRVIWTGRRI